MGVSEPVEPTPEQAPDQQPVEAPPLDPTPPEAAPATPSPEPAQPPEVPSTPSPEPASPGTEPEVPSSPEEVAPASEPAQEPAEAPSEPDVVAALEHPPLPGPGDPGPGTRFAHPVRVDNMSRRSDNDALEGHFCDIVSGEHAGRTGVFDQVVEYDSHTGYPAKIIVITRDADNAWLVVAYEDVRPSASTGSRS